MVIFVNLTIVDVSHLKAPAIQAEHVLRIQILLLEQLLKQPYLDFAHRSSLKKPVR